MIVFNVNASLKYQIEMSENKFDIATNLKKGPKKDFLMGQST